MQQMGHVVAMKRAPLRDTQSYGCVRKPGSGGEGKWI